MNGQTGKPKIVHAVETSEETGLRQQLSEVTVECNSFVGMRHEEGHQLQPADVVVCFVVKNAKCVNVVDPIFWTKKEPFLR